jgi:hypothetical protein
LTPDSIFCDEDDLASLEDVGHHGLHAGVAGGRDRQRERVLRLQLELKVLLLLGTILYHKTNGFKK